MNAVKSGPHPAEAPVPVQRGEAERSERAHRGDDRDRAQERDVTRADQHAVEGEHDPAAAASPTNHGHSTCAWSQHGRGRGERPAG